MEDDEDFKFINEPSIMELLKLKDYFGVCNYIGVKQKGEDTKIVFLHGSMITRGGELRVAKKQSGSSMFPSEQAKDFTRRYLITGSIENTGCYWGFEIKDNFFGYTFYKVR